MTVVDRRALRWLLHVAVAVTLAATLAGLMLGFSNRDWRMFRLAAPWYVIFGMADIAVAYAIRRLPRA